MVLPSAGVTGGYLHTLLLGILCSAFILNLTFNHWVLRTQSKAHDPPYYYPAYYGSPQTSNQSRDPHYTQPRLQTYH